MIKMSIFYCFANPEGHFELVCPVLVIPCLFSFLAIWDLFRCFMSPSLRLHGWLLPLCRLFATRDQISVPTPVQTARFLLYFYLVHDLFIPDLPLVFFHYLSTLLWSVSGNTVHESFPLSYFSAFYLFSFFSVSVPHLLPCPIYLFGLWSRRNSLQQEGPFPRASQLLLAYHAVSSLKS